MTSYKKIDQVEAMNFDRLRISLSLLILITCSDPVVPCLFSKNVNKPREFSPDNFIVRFNPYIHKDDSEDTYKEEDLSQMVTQISTKFSNILASRIGWEDVGHSLVHVAPAIANYNRERNATYQRVLKAFMAFDADGVSGDNSENSTSFDLVYHLAQRANSIFPGTVEYLLVQKDKLGEPDAEKVLNLLTDVKEKLNGNDSSKPNSKFKLGALFPLSVCGGYEKNIKSYLIPLLDHLQLLVLHLWPTHNDYNLGVDETILSFTKEFQRCKEKIAELSASTEMAFRTKWSDTDFENNRNYTNLVLFWRKMNDWAVKTNAKVFMLDAFDNPFRENEPNENKQGWWRLKSRRHFNSTNVDVYEDKMEVAIRNREWMGEPISRDTWTWAKIIGMFVLVFSALLIVTAICMVLLYKRITQKFRRFRSQHKFLTSAERDEFFNGARSGKAVTTVVAGSLEGAMNSVTVIAYAKEYELDKSNFAIDETSNLGSGNFGVVYKGKVQKGLEEEEVAVKMLKHSSSLTGLKDLLSEIKTLSYLGRHQNVVGMVGAYTKELKKGKVYVFTELCERGSLEKYLRWCVPRRYSKGPGEWDSYYIDNLEPCRASVSFSSKSQQPITKELYRWSYEIACGMEFLASKHIVHADLATRNVLLTKKLTAKISDFGLSRRLYDYQSYVKSHSGPLPWRLLAPESLCRAEFNEKTDIWAYGVTLWEIYSLGDQPYPGLSWTADFATKLCRGLRPLEPQYNADDMYNTMLRCWNIDPAKRPSFQELRGTFNIK